MNRYTTVQGFRLTLVLGELKVNQKRVLRSEEQAAIPRSQA